MSIMLVDDAAALPVSRASSAVLAKKSIVANSSATRFKTRCKNGGEIVVVVVDDVSASIVSVAGTGGDDGAAMGTVGV